MTEIEITERRNACLINAAKFSASYFLKSYEQASTHRARNKRCDINFQSGRNVIMTSENMT